jgi:hypothetical protein
MDGATSMKLTLDGRYINDNQTALGSLKEEFVIKPRITI